MDKNTNLTNPAVTAITRADVAGGVKKAPGGAGSPAGQPPPALPNFAVLARRILGNWPLIVAAVLLGAPISIKVSRSKKPVFKSDATIVFRGGVNGDPSIEALKSFGNRIKESSVAATTLKRVVDDLHLAPQATARGQYDGIVGMMRAKIETKSKGADAFTVSYSAGTPDEAQQVTQRICEVIIEDGTRSRQDRAKDSIDFLESEKKRADDDLQKAEKTRTIFMSEHPEFATDGKDGATIRAEQKASANQKKKVAGNAARVRRAAGNGGGANPAPPPGFGPVPPAAAAAPAVDPVLVAARNQARAELAAARKSLAEKSINLTEQHPDVRAAGARVAAAEASLAQAEASIAAAQPDEPAPAPSPVAATGADPYEEPSAAPVAALPAPVAGGALTAEKPKAKPRLTEDGEPIAVEIEGEWSRLNREVGEAKARRGQLEGRLFQAEISANSEVSGYGSQMVLLEPASQAGAPSGPDPKLLRLAGMAVAVIVGVVLAAVRGILFDDRLFDASEVESLGLVPLLGSVPKAKTEKKKRKWLGRLRG